VTFDHDGRQVTHRGLVIFSNPMATAVRQSRATHLRALRQELTELRAKIGQPRYRTVKARQRSVNARLKASPVGPLLAVTVEMKADQLDLRWQIETFQLWQAMQADGRYLLVTNDGPLAPRQILALYRRKDGVEKRFRVTKSDLQLSPIYVHLDRRLEGLLLVNMIALLAYSLLERQMHLAGLKLTTRRLIEKLEPVSQIETYYLDGSCRRRLTPMTPDQVRLWHTLADLITDLALITWQQPLLPDTPPQPQPDLAPAFAWPLIA
jgi:transposase